MQETRSLGFLVALSGFWFGLFLVTTANTAVVWPSQIRAIIGEERKELFNGLIPALGGLATIVFTPLAGSFSDARKFVPRFGKRRPYIVLGVLLAAASLLWCSAFGSGSSAWAFLLPVLSLNAGLAIANGPYGGLLPDLVSKEQRGFASGLMGMGMALGNVVGAAAAGALAAPDSYFSPYLFSAIALAVASLPTVLFVREEGPPLGVEAAAGAWSFREFFSSLAPRGEEYRDFRWVLGARTLFELGVWATLPFFQYFFSDVFGEKGGGAERSAALAVLAIVLCAIPTTLAGGWLSDRIRRRKPIVYGSCALIVASLALLSACTLLLASPSYGVVYLSAALFGAGFGSFGAVDWALAVDVLPRPDEAAKDLGVWNISFTVPQVVAPLMSGLVLASLKGLGASPPAAYGLLFVFVLLLFAGSALALRPVREASLDYEPIGEREPRGPSLETAWTRPWRRASQAYVGEPYAYEPRRGSVAGAPAPDEWGRPRLPTEPEL